MVDNSSYPTEKITKNARNFRELGLGYANLGGLLMTLGVPYDSDEGRAWGGLLTSILTGEAYKMSAEISKAGGSFKGYINDRENMLGVIKKHYDCAEKLINEIENNSLVADEKIKSEAVGVWREALETREKYSHKNS